MEQKPKKTKAPEVSLVTDDTLGRMAENCNGVDRLLAALLLDNRRRYRVVWNRLTRAEATIRRLKTQQVVHYRVADGSK